MEIQSTRRNVQFNEELVEAASILAPSFEFSVFAQAAVREKLDRLRREISIEEKLLTEDTQ